MKLADNVVHFARALRKAGVPVGPDRVIDGLRALDFAGVENRSDFYWTLDYHHNARGYALMAETIAQEFERRQILPGLAPAAQLR